MTPSTRFVDEQTTRALFDRARLAAAADGCGLDHVDAQGTGIEIGLFGADGNALPRMRAAPAEGPATSTPHDRGWTIEIPDETARVCPATAKAVREALTVEELGRASSGGAVALPVGVDSPWGVSAPYVGVAFVLLACATLRFLVRAVRAPRTWDRQWTWVSATTFLLALVLRLGVEPTLLTWYADVLPAVGPPIAPPRFGPGGALMQAALRALLPWNDTTLFTANAVIGALAVPLFVRVLRERAVPIAAAFAVGVLFAIDPLHVRASASPRDHVLASTFTVFLLVVWARGARSRSTLDFVLGLLLMVAVVFTRVDAWPQLVTIPAWTLLRDRTEPKVPGETWRACGYWAAWATVGAAAYFTVRVPSHHPLPSLANQISTLTWFIPQFFVLAVHKPYWVSPVTAALAAVGAVSMARTRPRLLACVVLSLAFAYVPLGRTLTHDELMGAHYFLATLPVFTVCAGYGFQAVLIVAGHRLPAAGALAVTGALALCLALPAYRYRYASQSEYAFLRRALALLPDGCEVHVLPVRDSSFDRDLDCCMDSVRSPLPATYPKLQFVESPEPLDEELQPRPDACIAWYEGAACSLSPSDDARLPHARALAMEGVRCDALHAVAGWRTLAETRVPGNAPDDMFNGRSPVIRLARLTPP